MKLSVFAIVLLSSCFPICAQDYATVSLKIDSMRLLDVTSQQNFIRAVRGSYQSDSLNEIMHHVFYSNCVESMELINEYGFPGFNEIGENSTDNLFIVFQHCDSIPENQKSVLGLMKDQVLDSNFSSKAYAYLLDRVLINSGKKQLYGTQLRVKWILEGYIPKPVYVRDSLDLRRIEIGLDSIDSYLEKASKNFFEMNAKNVIRATKKYESLRVINQEFKNVGEVVDSTLFNNLFGFIELHGIPSYFSVGEELKELEYLISQLDSSRFNQIISVLKGEANKSKNAWLTIARLTDLYSIEQIGKQIYGTILLEDSSINSEQVYYPILNEEEVDIRRDEIGLPPLDISPVKKEK